MIIDFPTSYWIREVIKVKTLELSFEDLRKHKKQLNKNVFYYLQDSSYLLWIKETIIELKELINFQNLSKSKNVDWSNKIISNFEKLLDFKELSKNQSIILDDTIIKKYEIRWDFDSFSSHSGVKWNLGLIKTFINKFDLNKVLQFPIEGINEDFINEYRNYIDWGEGCNNYTYSPAPIAGYNHISISVDTLNEKATNWEVGEYVKPYWSERRYELGEWHRYSSNEFLTAKHLETFVEKLSWDLISSNEFITITNQLLLKFSDKWNWSIVLNRNDFKLEHFYTIYQYLDYDFLSVNSRKIFELLEPDKNKIFTHIKGKLDNINNFNYSLRGHFFGNDMGDTEHYKLIRQIEKEYLVKRCKSAVFDFKEFNNDKNNVDRKRHYKRLHYWLHKYFRLYNEISSFPGSLKKTMAYPQYRDFDDFYYLYINSESDFKKNYFDVYK